MHWRCRLRRQQLLDECEVPPEVIRGGLERLAEFARPCAECLARREQKDHARTYLAGLVSDPGRKNTESIAYRHDQERHGLQHFVGSSTRDHRPLLRELAGQVAREIGTPAGVIVFDPSGFAKKGRASAGVQRQWRGRFGKVDNGQVGVFMAYASYREHALVDVRLDLQGVGQGPGAAQAVRHPQVGPLPHAARAGVGDARGDRPAVAARLGHRR